MMQHPLESQVMQPMHSQAHAHAQGQVQVGSISHVRQLPHLGGNMQTSSRGQGLHAHVQQMLAPQHGSLAMQYGSVSAPMAMRQHLAAAAAAAAPLPISAPGYPLPLGSEGRLSLGASGSLDMARPTGHLPNDPMGQDHNGSPDHLHAQLMRGDFTDFTEVFADLEPLAEHTGSGSLGGARLSVGLVEDEGLLQQVHAAGLLNDLNEVQGHAAGSSCIPKQEEGMLGPERKRRLKWA